MRGALINTSCPYGPTGFWILSYSTYFKDVWTHIHVYIYIAGRLTDYKYTYGRSDEQRTNVSEPLHLLALLYPMLIPGRENTQA